MAEDSNLSRPSKGSFRPLTCAFPLCIDHGSLLTLYDRNPSHDATGISKTPSRESSPNACVGVHITCRMSSNSCFSDVEAEPCSRSTNFGSPIPFQIHTTQQRTTKGGSADEDSRWISITKSAVLPVPAHCRSPRRVHESPWRP